MQWVAMAEVLPPDKRLKASCDVSVIIPVYNAAVWLDDCLQSVYDQDFNGSMEVSVFNDSSSDNSMDILEDWKPKLLAKRIPVKVTQSQFNRPKGVGFAKNSAIKESVGEFLCFLDADDVMTPSRISLQYEVCIQNKDAIVGAKFSRQPEGSTERYTRWGNTLSPSQLLTQIYTAHGPTVIMPTWFCARSTFDRIASFSEEGKGTPEDLIFFYAHLREGGSLVRVDEELLMYRYHPAATTFSVSEDTIWNIRVSEFQARVLSDWTRFTIWNAGKQGRKLYRSLSRENQAKVVAFCDVDVKKLAKGVYTYEESTEKPKPKIPIVHFSKAAAPFVICVKQDLTAGQFEENLKSLNLTEGRDYFFFS